MIQSTQVIATQTQLTMANNLALFCWVTMAGSLRSSLAENPKFQKMGPHSPCATCKVTVKVIPVPHLPLLTYAHSQRKAWRNKHELTKILQNSPKAYRTEDLHSWKASHFIHILHLMAWWETEARK